MAATNRCPRGSEGGDAVSDTPRTDDMVDQNGLSCQCAELPTCLARQLERELAAEKDASEQLEMMANKLHGELSASQQEARRLQQSVQDLEEQSRILFKFINDEMQMTAIDPRMAKLVNALTTTPAPVHKDTERLNFCDTMIDLEPGFYVLRFPVTESCTIRDAIDAELARND